MRQARMTGDELRAKGKRNKYGAKANVVDGVRYDSKLEHQRHMWLLDAQSHGIIRDLKKCERGKDSYKLAVNGVMVTSYTPDFEYTYTADGLRVVEDVKSSPTRTRDYIIRKKLMLALCDIEVSEWPKT
jgi:hypothetical protein